MKVQDLIRILSAFEYDTEVCLYDNEWGNHTPVQQITIEPRRELGALKKDEDNIVCLT